jgi:hypothetical protein
MPALKATHEKASDEQRRTPPLKSNLGARRQTVRGQDSADGLRLLPEHPEDRARSISRPRPVEPGSDNRLDIGSTSHQRADLLARLTGEEAEVRRIPSEQQGEQALLDGFRDQLSAGKPVLVGTRGLRMTDEKLPYGIEAGHAYEVTKVENGMIHIRNPWGYDHPDPMDTKTFWEYYRRYNYDGTRDGDYTTLK